MPNAIYTIWLTDQFGNKLRLIDDYLSLGYTLSTNSVTRLTIDVPGTFPITVIQPDRMLQVWRQTTEQFPRLEGETVWFVRDVETRIINGKRTYRLAAYSSLYLLEGATIAYHADTSYTSKKAPADDMIKAIVRENRGPLSVDPGRAFNATYFRIAPDVSLAPEIEKGFSWRPVLPVLQEIAQASAEQGTYLAFDIVTTQLDPLILEFRTFVQQRGIDQRYPGGIRPLNIGPDVGNLDDVIYRDMHSSEINVVYVGGQSIGLNRATAHVADLARAQRSLWSRRESFYNISARGSASMTNAGNEQLQFGQPYTEFSGKLLSRPGSEYGTDWGWGSYTTATVDGRVFDSRIETVRVELGAAGNETIEAWVKR